MDAAHTLRASRQRAGLTQSALAERARTSQATLSAYENGAKQPSLTTFSRLLAATGSRLKVEPAPPPVVSPSREQLARAGRGLVEVIGLAEALPVRHEQLLRFPKLDVGRAA